jgi:hypothetical protein
MPNNIILKKSSVVDKVPLPGDLQFGELALNFADGNLFYKNSANAISTIASNKFVSVTGNVTGSNVTGTVSLNTAGNINFTNAEASDTAKIYANVSGATTSLVMEVSDDLATDRIVLRHRYFATANTVDMLSAQLSGNTEANVTITGNLIATNQVIATGNVTGGNITTAGLISATGNITGGNLRTGGQVSATGTITGGNLNVSGNAAAGILLNVTDTAPAGSSKAFNIASGTNGLAVVANITNGSYNALQSTGDIALVASGATIGNVGFSIIPWAGANSGIRMNTVSNVTSITLAATTVSITGATVGTGNITGGNILTAGLISATGNITAGNITSNGDLTVSGNLYTNNLNTVLNDISNQFDNVTSVFALRNQQANVANIVNSRDIQVVVGGQTLSPYVAQANWPFVGPFFTPYDSFRGFRVKSDSVSSNVIIYNSPAIGDQATITIINNSTTVQTRRYPYSPETIAFGD